MLTRSLSFLTCMLIGIQAVIASPAADLFQAIADNDVQSVTRILSGPETEVTALLETKLDDRTPLLQASASTDPTIVQMLLAAGANPNTADSRGITAVMRASYYGSLDAVTALIDAGADLHLEAESGYAAFDFALENNQEAIMHKLLDDLSDENTSASTRMAQAVIADDHSALTTLLAEHHPNRHNATGYAPLPLAVRLQRRGLVNLLLEHDADPNIGNDGNDEAGPLHQAARGGHLDTASLLVNAGSRVDKPNGRGFTSLMLAILYGHADMARWLMTQGADPDRQNHAGDSARSLAMQSDHSEIRELFASEPQ